MNHESSRSHSVFIIKVDVADNDIKALASATDPGKHLRQGRLNLVDLAGSERQSKTGAQVTEGAYPPKRGRVKDL